MVHLADFDLVWCENLVQEISRKFAHHIIAGRLLVIQAPEEYYPSLDGLKRNYNDPEDRVRGGLEGHGCACHYRHHTKPCI